MRTREQLRPYQQRCVEFINAGEDALIYADVGTGKTAIGLTAMLDSGLRWLVVAPEKVARLRWPEEVEMWEHTQHLDLRPAVGTPTRRYEALASVAQIVTISYENLVWFLEWPGGGSPFSFFGIEAIFFDEVDKLKDPSTNRFKALRQKKGGLLRPLKKRVGATGTPTPDHLLDVWAQAYVTDLGESLGTSFDKFKKTYFFPTDFYQFNWAPFPSTQTYIYDALAGLVERVSREDCKDMPAVIDLPPRWIDLTKTQLKQYRTLERTLSLKIDDDTSIDAASEGVLSGMLQQYTSGFLYTDNGTHDIHQHKFDDLDELVSELQGQQLLVVYHFIEEARALKRRYPESMRLGGGVSNADSDEAIARWNDGTLRMLVLHRQSAGHGLDLQHAQPAHIYFMTRPWSAGAVEQVVGRIARPGGADHVWMHTPVVRGTVDEDVLAANSVKAGWQDAFRAAFKKRIARLQGEA